MENTHNSKAMTFVFIAVVAGTGMDAFVKQVGEDVDTWQLLFLRWCFAALLLIPMAVKEGAGIFVWKSPKAHLMRGVLNCVASFLLFYSLANLPLAVVVTIFFAEPLFIVPISALWLREKVAPGHWLATLVGFIGVLLIARPSGDFAPLEIIYPLAGALGFALLHIGTKKYGSQESPISLMFWLAILTILMSGPMAVAEWSPVSVKDFSFIGLIAVLGSVYSYFWIVGLRIGSAAIAAHISYLALPLAYLIGWAFFDETPDFYTLLGSGVIFLSVLMVSVKNGMKLPLPRALRRDKTYDAKAS
ncbi:Permease of the drug/metabolite transporter (DMT) superfamily [Hahella chejuensis KCTC 2396]|uniref:Permease of the drug/metabolite transporter (DMT) superfamily n=1 Tax=Hahella chejuensis (strain KCTC 2396) TaxID=349521 RepID=Q2SFZ4_HAHCH|nr:DMT family transporter [Hahella chejuensis]ABC30430.1 Permease of the drug/metabolite transporter (DMT) superfamily [Hahella chejuensis KCTC 2396]